MFHELSPKRQQEVLDGLEKLFEECKAGRMPWPMDPDKGVDNTPDIVYKPNPRD